MLLLPDKAGLERTCGSLQGLNTLLRVYNPLNIRILHLKMPCPKLPTKQYFTNNSTKNLSGRAPMYSASESASPKV